MGVYDVTSKTTGGIGAIRGVENKVTFNIPIAYAVEGGITKVVYKEAAEVYTPTGDTYYLYNRGTMSEVLGGFTVEGDSFTVTEESGYLAIKSAIGPLDGRVVSNHLMNLTEYLYVNIEYEYVNASTGATMTAIGTPYLFKGMSTDGAGQYNNLFLFDATRRIGRTDGFFEETYITIEPYSGDVMSETEEVILKVYSIWVSKTTT